MSDGSQMTGRRLVESFPRASLTADRERVTIRELPAREGSHVPAEHVLRPRLARALPYDPYAHQASALDALAEGENVTVATSTSSGCRLRETSSTPACSTPTGRARARVTTPPPA